MSKQRGFTLVELLIVGVILATLAAVAIPNYFSSMEAGRLSEAKTNLQIMYTGQKVYLLNHGIYWLPTDANPTADTNPPTVAAVNDSQNLGVDISSKYYDIDTFTIDNSANPKTFTVKVKRNLTSGGSTSTFYTIDQNGTMRDKNNAVVSL